MSRSYTYRRRGAGIGVNGAADTGCSCVAIMDPMYAPIGVAHLCTVSLVRTCFPLLTCLSLDVESSLACYFYSRHIDPLSSKF